MSLKLPTAEFVQSKLPEAVCFRREKSETWTVAESNEHNVGFASGTTAADAWRNAALYLGWIPPVEVDHTHIDYVTQKHPFAYCRATGGCFRIFSETGGLALSDVFVRPDAAWEQAAERLGGVPLEQLRAPGDPAEWLPETPDMVNEPPHYKAGGIETIDAIQAALTPEEFRGFCKGNSLNYAWRERHKGGDEDLKKAAWYLNRLTR